MNDSNGKNDDKQLAPSLSEIGQLKEAVGRLYKEFNDFKISQKAEREQDRAELKAWAETNLIQTQLTSKQTAVIEILTAVLKNKENSWQQSELHSSNLVKELTLLKNQLRIMPKSSPQTENNELKGLSSEVAAMRQALSSIPTKLDRINTLQSSIDTRMFCLESPKRNSQIETGDLGYSSWVRAGQTAIVFLICFFIFSWIGSTIFPARTPGDTMAYLQEIWERTGWTNTKLQRIEKKLGTTPRQ